MLYCECELCINIASDRIIIAYCGNYKDIRLNLCTTHFIPILKIFHGLRKIEVNCLGKGRDIKVERIKQHG